jgi:hypothetical protein
MFSILQAIWACIAGVGTTIVNVVDCFLNWWGYSWRAMSTRIVLMLIGSLPAGTGAKLGDLWGYTYYFQYANHWFPMDWMLTLISSYWGFFFAYGGIRWMIRLIRGV